MDIIIAIHPRHIDKISAGIKKYEFRRSIYKNDNVKRAFIYATVPIKKIVGYFEIEDVVKGTADEIWDKCGESSGSTKESLFKYFEGKSEVYALKIKEFKYFNEYIEPRNYIDKFYPPQFFRYIENADELFMEYF